MKTLFSIVSACLLLAANCSAVELNKPLLREVGSKCIAAFQRNPTSVDLIGSPMAYCTCVAEYVAGSKDDRRAATDRSGMHCLQAMKSPDMYGSGMARAIFDGCVNDAETRKYFPASYSKFCTCLGSQFSASVMDKAALEHATSSDFGKLVDAKLEAATGQCISRQ